MRGEAMRIALVITHFDDLGGAQVHVAAVARALAAAGDEVLVAHGGQGAAIPVVAGERLHVRAVPALRRALAPVADLRAIAALRRVLAAFAPDLVHAHSSKAAVYATLAARSLGLPSVATAHGWAALLAPPFGGFARPAVAASFRIGLAAASRVLCLSEHDLGVARRHRVAPGRLALVPIGIADVAERASPAGDAAELVTIARHCPQKDATTLIRALAEIRDLPWRLWWYGGGPELEQSRRAVDDAGLQGRIHLLGDDPGASRALADATCFVLASHAEGLPLAVLEAMRCGLPIVATAVGAVGEALDGAGTLVQRQQPAQLAAALRRHLVDPELRARQGAAARLRFEARYREEPMLASLRALYREVRNNAASISVRPA